MTRVLAAIKAAVASYPGGITAVLGLIVALGARFAPGLHLTATELATAYAVTSAGVGAYVHVMTVPKPKAPAANPKK